MVRDIHLYPNSEPHSHSLSLPAAQITLVRRVIEHMLSLYSYCNFSAQVITLYVISCTLHYFITPAHFITKYGLTLYDFFIRIWMATCDSLCCCSALNGPVVNSLFSLIRCWKSWNQASMSSSPRQKIGRRSMKRNWRCGDSCTTLCSGTSSLSSSSTLDSLPLSSLYNPLRPPPGKLPPVALLSGSKKRVDMPPLSLSSSFLIH